jgi:hypothetical protein
LLANGESQVISIAYGGFFAKIFKVNRPDSNMAAPEFGFISLKG